MANVNLISKSCYYFSLNYEYEYTLGSVYYNLAKAKKGIYEKVVPVYVDIKNGIYDGYSNEIYVDTLNGSWNPGELCSYATAQEHVEAYKARMQTILFSLPSCQKNLPC